MHSWYCYTTNTWGVLVCKLVALISTLFSQVSPFHPPPSSQYTPPHLPASPFHLLHYCHPLLQVLLHDTCSPTHHHTFTPSPPSQHHPSQASQTSPSLHPHSNANFPKTDLRPTKVKILTHKLSKNSRRTSLRQKGWKLSPTSVH